MTLVDTHAHLYSEKFNVDINDVIKRSQDAGVERIYMPNIDSKSIDSMLELEHNVMSIRILKKNCISWKIGCPNDHL